MRASTASPRRYSNHEGSYWMRVTLAGIERKLQAGRVRVCQHLATHRGQPPVCVYALWKPGRLFCPTCASEGAVNAPPELEHTCDRCQGPIGDGQAALYGAELAGLRIWVGFGLCPTCTEREVGLLP